MGGKKLTGEVIVVAILVALASWTFYNLVHRNVAEGVNVFVERLAGIIGMDTADELAMANATDVVILLVVIALLVLIGIPVGKVVQKTMGV